jgi:AraC family transcriptional regulator
MIPVGNVLERGFFGRVETLGQFDCARVFESSYAAQTTLPVHAHALAHFCFVIDGRYCETLSGEVHARGPGTLVFYPAESAHSECHETTGSHFLVEINPYWMERATPGRCRAERPVELAADQRPMMRRMRRQSRRTSVDTAWVAESILLKLLGRLNRYEGPPERRSSRAWLRRLQRRLDETFLTPPSLTELSAEAGIHPAHLTRAFRREFGCSIGQYARRLRVEYACRRIGETNVPLAAIALEAGFADQSHMCRLVRDHSGVSPSTLRKAELYGSSDSR